MHPVAYLDMVAVGAWTAGLAGMLLRRPLALSRQVRLILLGFLTFSLCYAICVFVEWAWRTTRLENVENLLGVTLPVWWAFAVYAMAQHLVSRDLGRSEERLQLALAGADLGIWDYDVRTGRLVHSARCAEMLGYQPHELGDTADDWQALIHPEDLPGAQAAAEAHLEGKTPGYDLELRLRHKSGEWIWLSNRGRVMERDAQGRPVRMTGTHMDITQRKAAEQQRADLELQLRQAQKLEAIGHLAGGVAHDFNNILTAILGTVELELDTLRSGVSSTQSLTESLEQIEKGAQRASNLTRQLLAFGRRQMIQPKLLDLNGVLRDLHKMLRRIIPENINLDMAPEERLAPVHADVGQLEQVLVNLAINAADAMPNGGRLTIETANVEVDEAYAASHAEAQVGPHVLLAVSDTGVGMTPEVRAHVFEPFFTTKPVGKGTGLGLATVYGIVKQAGGHVNVYSESGQGSTFKVYLPVADPETVDSTDVETVAESSPQIEEGLSERRRTLLLCEDDTGVRTLAARLLESAGYRVLAASCGEEALQAAADEHEAIDLLVTDVVMPDMNGRQLSDRLRGAGVNVPTLFVSGYTANVIAHHGVLDEGVEFLEKPFTAGRLLARIREVLARHEKAQEEAGGALDQGS